MRAFVWAAGIISLLGCATNFQGASAERVGKAVTVTGSEYDRATTYGGPPLAEDTRRGVFQDNIHYALGASKDKTTKAVRYFLYVNVLYIGDWRLYQSISLPGGVSLPAKTSDQKVNFCGVGCSHTETFIVELPSPLIADAAEKGMRFRINARNGANDELTLDREYVVGMLAAVSANKVHQE